VYAFIAAEKANYPISLLCRVLAVNRPAFHDWERRPPSDRDLYDAFLLDKIRAIHAASAGTAHRASTPSSGSSTASGSARSAWSG